MKRIRYLTMLLALLLGSTGGWAQSGFNPDSPDEPGPASTRLVLRIWPDDAGYTSGAGRYVPGHDVSIRAYENTGFIFNRWEDSQGNVVSRDKYCTLVKSWRADTLTAVYTFDPNSPADPADPRTILYRTLTLRATEGGSVSGSGRYLEDATPRLYAYPNTDFDFAGWYDADGNRLSGDNPYAYTMPGKPVTVTAQFRFNPGSPTEPVDPQLRPKHYVMATATDGGTVNFSSVRQQEGKSVYMEAQSNSGYVFDGWYVADTLYTKATRFSYTMGKADISFEARFRFAPDSPTDPGAATDKRSAFYLMNIVGKPGDTIRYPVYLNSLTPMKDLSLQLTFDPNLKPDVSTVEMSAKAEGYTVSCTAVNDTVYAFSLIGGSYPITNAPLVIFSVAIPDTTATGRGYPVKINQVSVMLDDGTATTTSTRNGRVSVYKLGDSNGDDVVNALDMLNVVTVVTGGSTKAFIKEVSDTNEDDGINSMDVLGISEIITNDD